MCGILVTFSKNHSFLRNFDSSLNLILHRGPDSQNKQIFKDSFGELILGSVRLSILDINHDANMPMKLNTDDIFIVYNGEIYNHLSLKESLINKFSIKFKSKSDTEVILNLYKIYGESFIEKLDGMFSFVIYDKEKNKILISRDHIGEKPLYFYHDNKNLIISSEINPILKLLKSIGFSLNLNYQSINEYLFIGHNLTKYNLFDKLKTFPPSKYLSLNLNEEINLDNTFSYNEKNYNGNKNADLNSLDEILQKDINKRIISDFPVGLFFSGGLDSSLIFHFLNQNKIFEVIPLTIRSKTFEKEGLLEYQMQDKLLLNSQINFKRVYYEDFNINDYFTKFLNKLDIPLGDTATFSLFLLSTFAKEQGFKVCISGDGSDELFGGYKKFNYLNYLEKFSFLPFNKIKNILPKKKPYEILDMNIFIQSLFLGTGSLRLNNFNFISKYQNLNIFIDNISDFLVNHFNQINIKNTIIDKLLSIEQKYVLPEYYLMKSDRGSMYSSLELRSIFTSMELYNYVNELKSNLLVRNNQNKIILKKLSERYFTKSFVYRKKNGFVENMSHSINTNFKDMFSDYIINSNSLISLKDHEFNSLNYFEKYKIFIMNYWYENQKKI